MHLASLAAALAAAVSPLVAQVTPATAPNPRSPFEATADFGRDPVPQIQAHLRSVIERLEARDVAHLTPAQRAARRAHLAHLAAYAAAGVFPQNEVAPHPTPVFIDDDGRACAVGHLMLQSDGAALARRIARQQNTAYVGELDQPALAAWVEASGLTAEECAWIQPSYGPCGGVFNPISIRQVCGPGAPNSVGSTSLTGGGLLRVCGSDRVVDNNLTIWACSLPMNAPGVLLTARDAGFVANPGGSQGNLCLGGPIGRFSATPFVAGSWFPWFGFSGATVLDLGQVPTPGGLVPVAPGETWFFQAWYRDQNPGPTSNFTDAIAIQFR